MLIAVACFNPEQRDWLHQEVISQLEETGQNISCMGSWHEARQNYASTELLEIAKRLGSKLELKEEEQIKKLQDILYLSRNLSSYKQVCEKYKSIFVCLDSGLTDWVELASQTKVSLASELLHSYLGSVVKGVKPDLLICTGIDNLSKKARGIAGYEISTGQWADEICPSDTGNGKSNQEELQAHIRNSLQAVMTRLNPPPKICEICSATILNPTT